MKVASNGRQAVETLSASPQAFDLVLMDWKMTGMDGIKQTFFEECDEQLTVLEVGLLDMQEGNHDLDRVILDLPGLHGAFPLRDGSHEKAVGGADQGDEEDK